MDKHWAQSALFASLIASSLAANAASLYDFNGNLDDSLGSGPALVDRGGSVVGGNYVFGGNQGLTLDFSGFNAASYDLTLRFSFESVGTGVSWRKIVDFEGRNTDEGLYSFDNHLQFVETAGNRGPEHFVNSALASFAPNQPVTLRITREGGSGLFTAFINGIEELSFVDSNGRAVFNTGQANFFVDDVDTCCEFSAGSVEFIAVNSAPVPLPASLPLLVSSLALVASRVRRRDVGMGA